MEINCLGSDELLYPEAGGRPVYSSLGKTLPESLGGEEDDYLFNADKWAYKIDNSSNDDLYFSLISSFGGRGERNETCWTRS